MKRMTCILLALLVLTGCRAGTEPTEPAGTTVAPMVTAAPPETTVPETAAPETTVPHVQDPTAPSQELAFTDPGKVRIGYEGIRSFVKFITSPEELPELPELEDFDAAFFQAHALVLIVETVNSGSVQLDIDKMTLEGDDATVTLKRTMSGEVGTSDMATWLLWAVVSREYDYNWTLESSTGVHNVEKY